jgi:hypothetical protein
MKYRRAASAALLALSLMPVSALAERIYPAGGGTRTEPDPNDKKQVRIVAESERSRITLSTLGHGKYKSKHPVIAIQVRVENRSKEPLRIDPTKYYLVDEAGQGYAGLSPQDAIKRSMDAMAGTMYVIGSVVAGPLSGPSLTEAAERKVSQEINQRALQPGDIPPNSFKEGLVFFETPRKPEAKHTTAKLTLVELWPEPFLFTIER